MEMSEGLSKEELKDLIREHLKEACIGHEAVEIEITEGMQVILRGKVDSNGERRMIHEIIMDVADIDDIVDELVVIGGISDADEYGMSDQKDVPEDQDEDFIGTEDVFQSVEDGVPYIPPTSPSCQESPRNIKWKKKRTNLRSHAR